MVQSVWRAVMAGVVAHPLFAAILSMVYWVLRPFVWAALYSESYRPPIGAHSPNSGEWLFVQGIGFCASITAGAAAAYWSPRRSMIPIAILIVVSLALLLFTQFPFDTTVFRNALYALHTPLGLVMGAVLLWRWQAVGEAI